MGIVVLFDRDASVADLMRQTLERSGSCDPMSVSDKEGMLLALTCRSDVAAAAVDATCLSKGEIDDLCLELNRLDARR